ncbi:MAG TPA: type II 3-dehydroquinate dehydratase [Planctomycetota bacterium]|nr:type II 3-dehydroquinate dehydratase [Planctomycetota bacterium]HRU52714.1 type II 3-dehydroquinate dehydratase [Planctomycetota bacterium]
MHILILHGPNLNLLGKREPTIYGTTTLQQINQKIQTYCKQKNIKTTIQQSNNEGELIDALQKADQYADAVIINPAAYSHTSVALHDTIKAIRLPTIEVHLTNIYAREQFRQQSLIASACIGQISGFGENSYLLAVQALIYYQNKKQTGL